MDAVGIALTNNYLNLAHEIYSNLNLEDTSDVLWGEIMEIALSLADSSLTWFSLDSTMTSMVTTIANSEFDCSAKWNAQSILNLVYGLDFIDSLENYSSRIQNFNNDPKLVVKSENVAINDLVIYPNPANSSVTIEFKSNPGNNVNVKIFDLSGKLVSFKNLAVNSLLTTFSISDLDAGFYSISVQSNIVLYSTKLLIYRE